MSRLRVMGRASFYTYLEKSCDLAFSLFTEGRCPMQVWGVPVIIPILASFYLMTVYVLLILVERSRA